MSKKSIIISISFVLLMFSIITPLSIFTIGFVMVPLVMLFTMLQVRSFAIHVAVSIGLVVLLAGQSGLFMLIASILILGPAVVMGNCFKHKRSAPVTLVATFISIIIVMLLVFLVFAAAGIHFVDEMAQRFEESFLMLQEMMVQPLPEETVEYTIYVLTQIIPLYMIFFATIYTIITYGVSRKILNRMGFSLPGLRPIKDWMVPKSIVWYYAIALVLSFVIDPEPYTILSQILLNLIPLLTIVFCIQAISFLFYIASVKKWNMMVPALGIVGCIILPTYMSIIGVFDALFQIRNHFK